MDLLTEIRKADYLLLKECCDIINSGLCRILTKIYKNKLYIAIRLDGHVINQEFSHTSYSIETSTLSPDNNIDNSISNTSLPCNFILTYNTLITSLFNFTYDPVDSN